MRKQKTLQLGWRPTQDREGCFWDSTNRQMTMSTREASHLFAGKHMAPGDLTLLKVEKTRSLPFVPHHHQKNPCRSFKSIVYLVLFVCLFVSFLAAPQWHVEFPELGVWWAAVATYAGNAETGDQTCIPVLKRCYCQPNCSTEGTLVSFILNHLNVNKKKEIMVHMAKDKIKI